MTVTQMSTKRGCGDPSESVCVCVFSSCAYRRVAENPGLKEGQYWREGEGAAAGIAGWGLEVTQT